MTAPESRSLSKLGASGKRILLWAGFTWHCRRAVLINGFEGSPTGS